jgi:hypothetical protein
MLLLCYAAGYRQEDVAGFCQNMEDKGRRQGTLHRISGVAVEECGWYAGGGQHIGATNAYRFR